ncbi:MAG: metallophosphoesterase family protein [Clostridia bacterium]|nr:metallophosphoesterase family protein [Clostridia bacterium]
MKLIVISDTHGRPSRILEVIGRHPSYDALIFLGDGLRDIDYVSDEIHGLYAVIGNCDVLSSNLSLKNSVREELFLKFCEYNIMITHGHKYGVKRGIEAAAEAAILKGADLLLYGHTHTPTEKYIPEGETVGNVILSKPLRIFNPGSLGEMRDGEATFGVIEIRGNSILMSHGRI